MNRFLPRFVRSLYGKDPLSSFILTIGLVDAVMGGVGGYWTLFGLGGVTVGAALFWRWLKNPPPLPQPRETPKGYLPPAMPLPHLTPSKHRNRR
ncbi:hypothetical protein PN462_07885 [Spirulina sp. CS-785/01]|uniref:hypothetical protein n=1 Tax=Spirulina sp. CS-785/01 TaxID=3021716 RepID=UPI00232CC5BE|nr:hypothetical protein [Spirulina sp. CS-785/01]MDB9313018.1 hypothetical protein [Spirulina sp. CS-785/01]